MKPKKIPYLAGLTAAQFLRDYWQKKPLLVRNAFPGFSGLLPAKDLLKFAQNDDVQSRLVQKQGSKWDLQHGPFATNTFRKLLPKNWTLLVQELNHHIPAAAQLLLHFAFIPHARLDDLMVSYAVPGGGVGAHVDSYDVFLLQGEGKRRWEISAQKNLELVADAPLKLLKKFRPQQEWLLEPGDMLYLPPRYAHKGTAVTECTTYSVGFRAPSHQELATQFLIYLQDHISLEGMYSDPQLKAQKHPAEISRDMLKQATAIIKNIKYNQLVIESFVGTFLTEPKPHVFFKPPDKILTEKRFFAYARKYGVTLAPESRLFFVKNRFFINGEMFLASKADHVFFTRLADQRTTAVNENTHPLAVARLCNWYNDNWVRFTNP
ncbi:MAG: cupin domain-containing protein [Burkholderiales bacterium]